MSYQEFLRKKQRVWSGQSIGGARLPPQLFDWQAAIPGRVLVLAPLCVAEQTVAEGAKLGIPITYAKGQAGASDNLTITNYERLDSFDTSAFAGVVLDESSILKAFDGKTRQRLIDAFRDTPYRLCCTATPSPNDIAELANHAEFLGLMTRAEFLATWFIHDDAGWRMKGHARTPFYRWLASWAVALRHPRDIGYEAEGYDLPPLRVHEHIVEGGYASVALFPELGLKGIEGRSVARKASVDARCATAAGLTDDGDQWLLWCGLNDEADRLAAAIPDAVNVQGSDSYEVKRDAILGFVSGRIRVLVTKMKIAGFGLNFQNCHNMAFVGIGDSYEQYYQAIRRCWRFGQQHAVDAHIIVSDAERAVVANVRRKQADADEMSTQIIAHMRDFEREELAS